jgi:hypothetical protein
MSRFIAVMGVGRCGSSAVAGMLHKGGLPLGENLIGPHPRFNALGHFEDPAWHRLNRLLAYKLTTGQPILAETLQQYPEFLLEAHSDAELFDAYREAIERGRRRPVWARKCIIFGLIWRFVGHLFGPDVRIIVVTREREAVVASRMAHSRLSRPQAEALIDALQAGIDDVVRQTSFPVLPMRYEDILEDPCAAARLLENFIEMPGFDVNAAEYHIDPAMNHHSATELARK